MTEEVKPQTKRGRAKKEEETPVVLPEGTENVTPEVTQDKPESGRVVKLPNGLTVTYH